MTWRRERVEAAASRGSARTLVHHAPSSGSAQRRSLLCSWPRAPGFHAGSCGSISRPPAPTRNAGQRPIWRGGGLSRHGDDSSSRPPRAARSRLRVPRRRDRAASFLLRAEDELRHGNPNRHQVARREERSVEDEALGGEDEARVPKIQTVQLTVDPTCK